ncbi:MAG: CtsR family transcriptional regulator [Synergistaceae bacterium]|jgi:transcriptional regulator CtsR|nr:CtsR family transcriptional regulator [Synergistaceae bacterium]
MTPASKKTKPRGLPEKIERRVNGMFGENTSVVVSLSEFAEAFNCAQSRVEPAIRRRFTPERGFIVERAGGGEGNIRVVSVATSHPDAAAAVGESVTEDEAREHLSVLSGRGLINERERLIIEVALRHSDDVSRSEFDLSPYRRGVMRAELLRRMLRALMPGGLGKISKNDWD